MKPLTFLSPLFLLGLARCSSMDSPSAAPTDVTVELDAFSGIPNPIWRLSQREASELAKHLRSAVPLLDSELPSRGLGFRGFAISNPDGDGGIEESVYVTAEGNLVDPVNGSIYAGAPSAITHLKEIASRYGYAAALGR